MAEVEQAKAQGHQPWRSDPRMVAQAGLLQVEPTLDPKTSDSVPFTRTVRSPQRQVFSFKLFDLHHVDEISVQRLRWRNPRTGKKELTGTWWATEVVISAHQMPDRK